MTKIQLSELASNPIRIPYAASSITVSVSGGFEIELAICQDARCRRLFEKAVHNQAYCDRLRAGQCRLGEVDPLDVPDTQNVILPILPAGASRADVLSETLDCYVSMGNMAEAHIASKLLDAELERSGGSVNRDTLTEMHDDIVEMWTATVDRADIRALVEDVLTL